jgi:hypothetical protein
MREIKFRAWDPKQKMLVDWPWLEIYADGARIVDEEGDIHDASDMPLMQYTCLKDKNGKEIYENDILRFPVDVTTAPQEILWSGHQWRTRNAKGWFGDPKSWADVEVIGNIYENPALLKS